ncbi:MAG TPA: hypothetical protein VMS43_14775 [Allosphingosinicella sp.]|nr:hypothetical protein [Allosphingosinicella sp.]
MTKRAALLAALTGALLAGCVTEGPFPSLAPRPDERLTIEEPVREAPIVADDPAVRARIADLLAEARQGNRTFEADYGAAARAARGGLVGSNVWIEAQQALSRVEAARGRTAAAAAELHQLALERADQPMSAADREGLDEAVAEADRLLAAQQARIDRLPH